MAARRWFTPERCEGLSRADCAILNTAARNLWSPGSEPSTLDLMHLRMDYTPGMSARALIDLHTKRHASAPDR